VLENFDQIKEAVAHHFDLLYTHYNIEGEETSEKVMTKHIPHRITK